MYVNINKDKLKKETSNIYGNLHENVQGIINVKNTVNSINAIWKGEEYNQFSNKMTSFLDDLNKFEESLETCMTFINNYLDAHEKLDSHYSNKKITIK